MLSFYRASKSAIYPLIALFVALSAALVSAHADETSLHHADPADHLEECTTLLLYKNAPSIPGVPFYDALLDQWIHDNNPPVSGDFTSIEMHNAQAAKENSDYLLTVGIPRFANRTDLSMREVLPALYRTLAQNHVFGHNSDHLAEGVQSYFRTKVFRNENRMTVVFGNIVPPHPNHLSPLLDAFTTRIETLLSEAKHLNEVFAIAIFARRTLIEMQPGVDLNTRSARAAFNYILARANKMKLISGNRKLPMINLSDPVIRSTVLPIKDTNGKIELLRPYDSSSETSDTGDYKSYIGTKLIEDLGAYARQNGRKYFFFTHQFETIPVPKGATELNFQKLPFNLDPSISEWQTASDFMLDRINSSTSQSLLADPAIKAEVLFLRSYYFSVMNPSHN